MTPFLEQTGPGVKVTNPSLIGDSAKRYFDAAKATIPPGKNGALIAIHTESGTNFVLAGKNDDGSLAATAWFGIEKGWQSPAFGFGVQWSF